jgi:hypothetical protein
MFPLAGKEFPTTSDELDEALAGALAEVFTLPKKNTGVSVTGGEFPDVGKVAINLDGASVTANEPPPPPVGVGKRKPGITVDKLQLTGHPIRYEQTKLDLELSASGLEFEFDRDKQGNPLLVLTDAKDGHVEAKISKKDIETIALTAATLAAAQQGIKVQELELDLKSEGSRSVSADVRVKAKKMMVSGVLRIRGRVDVDDALNATLSDLSCAGEGMIGTMAAGTVEKHLKPYEGKQIPLMAFSLGDLTLHDLQVEINGAVRVTASFGSGGGGAKKAGATKAKSKAKKG